MIDRQDTKRVAWGTLASALLLSCPIAVAAILLAGWMSAILGGDVQDTSVGQVLTGIGNLLFVSLALILPIGLVLGAILIRLRLAVPPIAGAAGALATLVVGSALLHPRVTDDPGLFDFLLVLSLGGIVSGTAASMLYARWTR